MGSCDRARGDGRKKSHDTWDPPPHVLSMWDSGTQCHMMRKSPTKKIGEREGGCVDEVYGQMDFFDPL
jgi:hypothetical protein